jgi:two-component system, cell cycle response regulator
MKILVADDEMLSRRLMERMLQRNGYEVITAENGREAAEILSCDDGPRLALIDWMMPELDGPGVCRQVRGRHDTRYIYIIVLTAKQASEDIVVGLEAGADDYLVKPCNPEELKARLRTGVRILDLEDKLVEAREEMRFKATHDALTSLWNRGSVVADFDRELTRWRRGNGVVSILICDIDHFKQVNDVHGHQVGDEVLRQISSRLLNSVRSYDRVGRYGGEEFLIVLSGCDSQLARRRAEEIRKAVAGRPFDTSGGLLSLSLSIGVLTSTDWDTDLSPTQLLNEADHALYRAKASGRNCVEFATPILNVPFSESEICRAHATS